MRFKYYVLFACLLSLNIAFAQLTADQFIKSPETFADMIHPEYTEFCKRLDNNYPYYPHKELIGYGLMEPERQSVSHSPAEVIFLEETIGKAKLITLNHKSLNRPVYYAMEDDMLISPYQLQCQDWTVYKADFVEYWVQDNDQYQAEQLEILSDYCEYLAELLKISPQRVELLRENKIRYYRCASAADIAKITGYQCRGMGILAEDAVISSYPCHFHELSHIMINYALQEIPLFTHPFLQEGFAVATGGRGGKTSDVLLDIASFLSKAGFMSPLDLIDAAVFYANDASLTYPVSGLYNRFLLETLGAEEYLKLYRTYSNDTGVFTKISDADLPDVSIWLEYLNNSTFSSIVTTQPAKDISSYYEISAIDDTSFTFDEDKRFQISLSQGEINVIDNVTGNLAASYSKGLSIALSPVKDSKNHFNFYLNKSKMKAFMRGF